MKKICPRCESEKVEKIAESPVSGKWDMFLCHTCLFSWRSTEPEAIQDPELYNKHFKIDQHDIPNYDNVPVIPERKTK
ncbi:non-oxidative hydroxyarylic acid decarboxylases subunit D [Tuberibacillus sp. Marseille-P3662]|uniref:non-oxidative hydroxyarylic acid decarboxylases subunit D n=1 Tax=Tuberibacillus sp. Marseille-P3662 TaxID=1965358 RepID=UPI000A1CC61C|nr:non-oxidative hydroxyarylic acid decarboxylases subunit D [Tuberibacillus sp. Marseille-P3662]